MSEGRGVGYQREDSTELLALRICQRVRLRDEVVVRAVDHQHRRIASLGEELLSVTVRDAVRVLPGDGSSRMASPPVTGATNW